MQGGGSAIKTVGSDGTLDNVAIWRGYRTATGAEGSRYVIQGIWEVPPWARDHTGSITERLPQALGDQTPAVG